jgi:hypothetical protein
MEAVPRQPHAERVPASAGMTRFWRIDLATNKISPLNKFPTQGQNERVLWQAPQSLPPVFGWSPDLPFAIRPSWQC